MMRREENNLRYGVARRRHDSGGRGFTLVEVLIVVIILGILATIVMPQFSTASEDARRNSLATLLQTVRSQLELYRLQHLDDNPPGLDTAGTIQGPVAWAEMMIKTDITHAANLNGKYGPYLQTLPVNSISTNAPDEAHDVLVVTADAVPGAASGAGTAGWIYNRLNGKLWATSKSGTFVYDEMNSLAATNSQ